MNNVDIIEFEDPSVKELLNKTAKDLHKKYNKQRRINERFLRKKSPFQKVLSIIIDIVCVSMLIVGFIVCFSIMNTTLNGYMPNFAGYTNLVVSTESMVASGYNVGDVVIIHSVDPNTLNVNDKIAFYVYSPSYIDFDVTNAKNVSSTKSKTKYTLTISQLFGFQTEEVKKAATSKSEIVFHHIRAIYIDEYGERWFKTYGSSNGGEDDSWWINEKYVVGIQDESKIAKATVSLVEFAGKPYGMITLIIPVGILMLSVILSFLKNIQIAKLELDCVEEKRKITDPICVKNKVGFQMSNKTKLKILAQATDENRDDYISLLWKNGKAPDSIEKYYLRKKLQLQANKELLQLNRDCEKMFKDKVNHKVIAEHYLSEKQKIESKHEAMRLRLKRLDKSKSENNLKNKKRTRK